MLSLFDGSLPWSAWVIVILAALAICYLPTDDQPKR